jgi:hypothetical protein
MGRRSERRRVISPEAANFRARIRHAREGSCDAEIM